MTNKIMLKFNLRSILLWEW